MKTPILIGITLFLFAFIKESNSQPQFYVEQNSGVTQNLTSVCMSGPNGFASQVWICGNSGTVLKSSDEGSNWINVSAGVPSTVDLININSRGIDTALTTGLIGTTTYVFRTENGGTNWSQVFSQPNGNIDAIWMKNALLGFMMGDPVGGRWSLWKTTNGGMSWDSTGLYLPQIGSENGWSNGLEIVNNNIWFGTNNSRIYRSTNYGNNWVAILTPMETRPTATWHFNIDSTFSYLGGGNLYKSTNGDSSWVLNPCPDTGSFKGFCVGPIGAYYNGINYTWYGPTFTIRGNSHIYISWQGGPNYQFINDYTAPSGNYNYLGYSNASYYYSAPINSWAVRSNGGITKLFTGRGGAVRSISTEIPNSYEMKQNFPNPFNPSTKIRFDLKREAFTSIKVYDVLGREVAVIVNEQLHAGQYEADFDASPLSSGIYYYRISAGDYSEGKKMVLIK